MWRPQYIYIYIYIYEIRSSSPIPTILDFCEDNFNIYLTIILTFLLEIYCTWLTQANIRPRKWNSRRRIRLHSEQGNVKLGTNFHYHYCLQEDSVQIDVCFEGALNFKRSKFCSYMPCTHSYLVSLSPFLHFFLCLSHSRSISLSLSSEISVTLVALSFIPLN